MADYKNALTPPVASETTTPPPEYRGALQMKMAELNLPMNAASVVSYDPKAAAGAQYPVPGYDGKFALEVNTKAIEAAGAQRGAQLREVNWGQVAHNIGFASLRSGEAPGLLNMVVNSVAKATGMSGLFANHGPTTP
jgi:hypothetical protein